MTHNDDERESVIEDATTLLHQDDVVGLHIATVDADHRVAGVFYADDEEEVDLIAGLLQLGAAEQIGRDLDYDAIEVLELANGLRQQVDLSDLTDVAYLGGDSDG